MRPNWGEERSSTPRRGRWSQAELAQLKEMYGLRDDKAIARELRRSEASVRSMANTVFEGEAKTGPWTDEDVAKLKKYLGRSSLDVVSKVLGRTQEDIEQVLEELAQEQKDSPWTQEEIGEFKRLYGTRTDDALALIFGRPAEAICQQAEILRLAKDKAFLRRVRGKTESTRMPRWRPDELKLLEELYPTHSNLEIAQTLNRSVKSVVSKAHHLGIKKDPARLREMGRENVSLRYSRKDGAEVDHDAGAELELEPGDPPEPPPREPDRGGGSESAGHT